MVGARRVGNKAVGDDQRGAAFAGLVNTDKAVRWLRRERWWLRRQHHRRAPATTGDGDTLTLAAG